MNFTTIMKWKEYGDDWETIYCFIPRCTDEFCVIVKDANVPNVSSVTFKCNNGIFSFHPVFFNLSFFLIKYFPIFFCLWSQKIIQICAWEESRKKIQRVCLVTVSNEVYKIFSTNDCQLWPVSKTYKQMLLWEQLLVRDYKIFWSKFHQVKTVTNDVVGFPFRTVKTHHSLNSQRKHRHDLFSMFSHTYFSCVFFSTIRWCLQILFWCTSLTWFVCNLTLLWSTHD